VAQVELQPDQQHSVSVSSAARISVAQEVQLQLGPADVYSCLAPLQPILGGGSKAAIVEEVVILQ
jgi:hypothetical protein